MEEHLAVLIDFENIAAGTEKEGLGRFDAEALMDRLKDKGRILVSRSYGDWGRFARFKQELLSQNVTMMELTSHGMQDKNRADIAMVVDCLELAFTRPYLDTFVIVSGDSDFTPLVLKMRELNKRVIGVGTRGSTSRLIINACDEFIFYDSVIKAKPKPDRAPSRRLPQGQAKGFQLLTEAIAGIQREDPTPVLASIVKTAVVRRQPDFSEEDLGFSSFARYLEAARDAGLITLTRDQKSGGYRVNTVDDEAPAAPAAAPAAAAAAAASDEGAVPEDAYYPPGSEDVLAILAAAELSPMAAPTRMALLEALVDSVKERDEKRRRVQISFAIEDIKRKLRRTHPDLSARTIKDMLLALLNAGLLMHKDGTAVRSPNASFTLTKTADQLNRKLTELYLRELKKAGADLTNVRMLAELFFGDPDRRRDVETALAWAAAPSDESGSDEAPRGGRNRPAETAVDDLFLVEDDAPAAAPAPRGDDDGGRRRGGRGRDRDRRRDDDAPSAHSGPVAEAAPVTAARPAQDPLDDLFTFEGEAPRPAARQDRGLREDRGPRDDRGPRRDDRRRDDRPPRDDRGPREDRGPRPPRAPVSDDLFLVEDEAPAAPAERPARSERSDRPPRPPRNQPAPLAFDDLLLAEDDAPAAPAAAPAPAPVVDELPVTVDDLFLTEEPAAPPAPEPVVEAAPAKKPRPSRAKKPAAEAVPAAEPAAEPVAEEAPAAAPAVEEAPAAEEAPAKAPRKRAPAKKKKEEPEA